MLTKSLTWLLAQAGTTGRYGTEKNQLPDVTKTHGDRWESLGLNLFSVIAGCRQGKVVSTDVYCHHSFASCGRMVCFSVFCPFYSVNRKQISLFFSRLLSFHLPYSICPLVPFFSSSYPASLCEYIQYIKRVTGPQQAVVLAIHPG